MCVCVCVCLCVCACVSLCLCVRVSVSVCVVCTHSYLRVPTECGWAEAREDGVGWGREEGGRAGVINHMQERE